MFEKLLDPQYAAGIVVDGFPRTVIQVWRGGLLLRFASHVRASAAQAECIWLLYQKMLQLRKEFEGDREVMGRLRRPIFRIAVLYVDENESVKRQVRCVAARLGSATRCAVRLLEVPRQARPLSHSWLACTAQLRRGDIVGSHNRRVEETGVGVKMVERPTDVSAELARCVRCWTQRVLHVVAACGHCSRVCLHQEAIPNLSQRGV